MHTHENAHDYCIILAGGVGSRLWPISRRALPKQFIDLFGVGRTLLQQTYDRLLPLIRPENIYVCTYRGYTALVKEQLPMLADHQIVSEPVQMSTAPIATWATWRIMQHDAAANILVSPADQFITKEVNFNADIKAAFRAIASPESTFLALGVAATAPRTAYGYIQKGAPCAQEGLARVKSFTEKPTQEFADMFIESDEFVWSTGLFLWRGETMLSHLSEVLPELARRLPWLTEPYSLALDERLLNECYPSSVHHNLDTLILEKWSDACVRDCSFGWCDIGSWPELSSTTDKDAEGNGIIGTPHQVILSGCHDSLIVLPERMGAVVEGLDGYLVALKDNMLVICPNDDPKNAHRIAGEVQLQMGDDFV